MRKRRSSSRDNFNISVNNVGQESVVGIAIHYELDGPGIESRWEARFSVPVQTGPGAYPASYIMVTGFFPQIKHLGVWY
jgi:hypothetical protein